MAKTKEKEIELKVKAEKISEEHLKELQQLINSLNQTHLNVGKIETQKHGLLHNIALLQDKVSVMQDTFKKDYGTDDINVVDGKINWPDEKKENSDEK